LQSNILNSSSSNIKLNEIIKKFISKTDSSDYWINYKLARLCVRYSYFNHASVIFDNLKKVIEATSQKTSFSNVNNTKNFNMKQYFEFYSYLCKAESQLNRQDVKSFTNLIENLNESLDLYIKAQFLLKSSNYLIITLNSSFQLRYIELRIEQTKYFIHISLGTMTYHTIPPPVFQYSSTDYLSKLGRMGSQMKFSVFELQKLLLKYKNFIKECFDADENTINILNILKKLNECMIFTINLLSTASKSEQYVISFN
jgi:hypothetical protein